VVALRGRERFERTLAQGRRARSGPLAVAVAPGTDPEGSLRLGLAVRVSGKARAVRRNRLRRRLRAAASVAGLEGRDVVVRAGAEALGLDFQDLVDHFRRAVARAERSS
jgi:ribonuclease P protein component